VQPPACPSRRRRRGRPSPTSPSPQASSLPSYTASPELRSAAPTSPSAICTN
jgi:hypothetical protein